MGCKRLKLDSKLRPKKCAERSRFDTNCNDWISRLPNDILIIILSLVPLKEAARTTILSTRFTNLWKHIPSLNFSEDNVVNCIGKDNKLRGVERRRYTKWVNSVLRSHVGPTLNEFRISFDLGKSSRAAITRWLDFAACRQVQRLQLDLLEYGFFTGLPCKNFTFPQELLTGPNWKSLRELTLKRVNLTEEVVSFFLCECPSLEKLVIDGTCNILMLEICGSSLKLKHLEFYCLYHVKSVRISAPNLSVLIVDRLKVVRLENVPVLSEVSVICGVDSIECLFPTIDCCISRLKMLTLELLGLEKNIDGCKFPELPMLKKLEVIYRCGGGESFRGLSFLMRAAPCLEEFVLKLRWSLDPQDPSWPCRNYKKYETELPHEHLKRFEFCGYRGRSLDFGFVRYIVENCVMLKNVVIDTSYLGWATRTREVLERENVARRCAKQQFEGKLPQNIDLVINELKALYN